MKKRWTSHELADLADALASALRSLPDMPVDRLTSLRDSEKPRKPSSERVRPVKGSARPFASLSRKALIETINAQQLPIRIGPKDSALKLATRLATYVRTHPDVAERLLGTGASRGSPELAKALHALRDMNEHGSTAK